MPSASSSQETATCERSYVEEQRRAHSNGFDAQTASNDGRAGSKDPGGRFWGVGTSNGVWFEYRFVEFHVILIYSNPLDGSRNASITSNASPRRWARFLASRVLRRTHVGAGKGMAGGMERGEGDLENTRAIWTGVSLDDVGVLHGDVWVLLDNGVLHGEKDEGLVFRLNWIWGEGGKVCRREQHHGQKHGHRFFMMFVNVIDPCMVLNWCLYTSWIKDVGLV